MRILVAAITFIAVILLIAGTYVYRVHWPKTQRQNTALIAYVVEDAIHAYETENPKLEQAPLDVLIATLRGDNPRQKTYLRPEFKAFLDEQNGLVHDAWKRPYSLEWSPEHEAKLVSSGKNGIFGDDDDVSSKDFEVN